jgi:hypothetical protein
MGAPSRGWHRLKRRDDGSLGGDGFSVRARTQARPDELWLNVELPDGSWSYVVIRDGTVVANEHAESKRDAYTRAVEAVAHATIG